MIEHKLITFILSHGRSDQLVTVKSLKKAGYTGDWKIILDNEDDQIDSYRQQFGEDHIDVFDKKVEAANTDVGDNFDDRNIVVYARNYCFKLAKKLGYEYFFELDDDYTSFEYRYKNGKKLSQKNITDMDNFLNRMISFMNNGNIDVLAMSQGGDFIGGLEGAFKQQILRKAMNTFILRADSDIRFFGRINEDVNMYVYYNSIGKKIFAITSAAINQRATQSSEGGLTEIYLENGTYLKSFYSVMYSPSSVKISTMGGRHKRIHHHVDWNATAPKILNEVYKK